MTKPNTLPAFLLPTLSGVLYFVGFVGFGQWYLAWLCLVPLLFGLRHARTWKRALVLSWWMGFVTHLGGYFWVVGMLEEFAHLPAPLAFLGYVLLCLGQSASLAAFGLLAWVLSKRTGRSIALFAAPALTAVEFAFPLLFQSYLANSQAPVPLATQIADLGGPLAVTFVIALVNAGLFELAEAALDRRRVRFALPLAALVALSATLIYGALRIEQIDARDAAAPKLRTVIVQANVGAADKHEKVWEGIRRFQSMTEEAMSREGVGLVVWPESALNRALGPQTTNLSGMVAPEVKTPMIVGTLRAVVEEGKRKVWNSAAAVEVGGEISAFYDKTELLAFGEYVPGGEIFPQIYEWLPYSSHFQRGASREPLRVSGWALSTDICYEDILPGFIRSLMIPIDDEGTRPHAMVNVTNDSWYGPHEPPIHLALATFRSIEHRRWLIRSTATGISAFVDSAGRVVKQTEFEKAQNLEADVPMITDGPTIYGRLGDWPGWLSLLACAAALRPRRRRAQVAAGEASEPAREAA